MKGIGKGVRSFKEGMNNIEKEIENPDGRVIRRSACGGYVTSEKTTVQP